MDETKKAISKLKDLSKSKKSTNIEECITGLSSTVALLELKAPSTEQYKNLSRLLRELLQPLYSAHLQETLNYSVSVLRFLHTEKIVPYLRSGDPGQAKLWEGPAFSVVSGILDYLEQHQTKKAKETVASAVHPTICALYFTNGRDLLSSYDGNVLSNAYMLLGETVESPGADVSNLRDRIGSRRLGHTIAEIRNYLALESIINLLGNLIPALKSGKEKRTKFLQEVFEDQTFKDSSRILKALEIIKRDWTVTATKIIHLLAESDGRFPQPFQIFRFQVATSPMTTSDPIFVDNESFIASLDQGGSVDSLVIPFTTVRGVTISALNGSEMKIELLTNKPPLLGNNPMSLPRQETYSVNFSISKESVNSFAKAMRERHLRIEHPAHRKLSQAPGELLPEFVSAENDKNWQEKAAMLTNMAEDKFATSSPRPGHSTSPNLDDHHDRSGFDSISPVKVPNTVFLDSDGNFSINPPQPKGLDLEQAGAEILSRMDPHDASEDEEIVLRPKRTAKSKTQTIVQSDEEDEDKHPLSPEVGESKKISKTKKKLDAAQSSKALTDGIPSRPTTGLTTDIVNVDSRQPGVENSNDTKKSKESKKRTLPDDASDVEASTAKRVCQDLENVPPSPVANQRQTRYNRKTRLASATNNNGSGFDFDFDEIPKDKQNRPVARAKAMKGKGGKVAPKPRPVARKKNKKQDEGREAKVEVEDADKTLVEQTKQLASQEIKPEVGRSAKDMSAQTLGGNRSENERSKKSNKAPWEMQDFANVKIEITEEAAVSFDAMDDMPSKIDAPSLNVVNGTESHDMLLHDEGERLVDFLEHERLDTTSSPEPLPSPALAKSGQVWIDLTNSPEPVETKKPTSLKRTVRKTPSIDMQLQESIEELEISPVHLERAFHATRIDKARKAIEKVPLLHMSSDEPESVSSTPRNTKPRQFSPPLRPRRFVVGGKLEPTQKNIRAYRKHLEEEEVRSRPIPKEQKSGKSSSRSGPRGSEDLDLRIAAILGEISKVLVGNVQKRFTGMSSDLRGTKREIKAQVAGELGKMNNELFKRYNGLVDLHEGFVSRTGELTHALEVFEKTTADSVQSYRDVLKDFRRNSLRNKLPLDLVKDSTLAEIKKLSKLNIKI